MSEVPLYRRDTIPVSLLYMGTIRVSLLFRGTLLTRRRNPLGHTWKRDSLDHSPLPHTLHPTPCTLLPAP